MKFFKSLADFEIRNEDKTYASVGYKKNRLYQHAQYFRKMIVRGRFDGLPPLGPDHILISMERI